MQNIAVAFVHAQSQPMYDDFNYIKTRIFFTPQRFYFEWFPCYRSTVLHLFSLLFSDFLTLIKRASNCTSFTSSLPLSQSLNVHSFHFISLSLSSQYFLTFSDFDQ